MNTQRTTTRRCGAKPIAARAIPRNSATIAVLCALAILPSGVDALAQAQAQTETVAAASDPYLLSPGDRVSITVFDQPDISGTYLVDPGGSVALPLIGPMDVTHFTPQDLQSELVSRLGDGYLQNPVINVRLAELRPVTIVGEVRAPGRYNYIDGMNVDTALALAGGSAGATGEEATRRSEFLQADGRLKSLTIAHLSQLARKARLEAQLADAESFETPAVDPRDDETLDRLMAGEKEMLAYEVVSQKRQTSLLSQQVEAIRSDIAAFEEQVELEKEQIAFLDEQIADFSGLLVNGLARKSSVLEIQREKARSRSNLSRLLGDLARSRSALAEAQLKHEDLDAAYRSRLMTELQATNLQLADTGSTLPLATEDRQLRLDRLPFAVRDTAGPPVVTISRYGGGGVATMVVDGTASVRPGDIVQVGRVSAGGTAEPVPSSRLPEPRLLDEAPGADTTSPERVSQR